MNKHLLWAMLCWLSLLAVGARAQNLDIKETFEALSTDHGYSNSTISPPYENGANVEYFERKPFIAVTGGTGYQGTTIGLNNRQGSYTWAGEGVRGTSSSIVRPAGYVVLNPITNSQNYKNFVINVAFAAPRGGNPNTGAAYPRDRIRVQYSFNGGAWTTGAMLMGNNARGAGNSARLQLLTNLADSSTVIAGNAMPGSGIILDPTYRDVTVTLPSTALGTNLRVRVVLDVTAVEVAFDNIRVTGDEDNAPKPVLSNIESAAASYTEGGSPVQLTNTLVVGYSNNSATNITGATVSIGGFVQNQDVLNFSTQNGISGSFSGTTGVLTLTGTASQANYQAALRTITYSNSNTTTATGGTRTITFQVANGSTLSTTATRNLIVVPALNAPAQLNYTEDFTTDGENTRYFGNTFVNAAQQTGFFRATNSPATSGGSAIGSATFSGQSGGYWFGEGTFDSGNNPTAPISTLQLAPVDTRGRSDIKFTIALGAAGTWRSYFNAANPADGFELFYRVNGGAPVKFGAFYGNGTSALQSSNLTNPQATPTGTALTTTLRDFTFSLPATTAGVANLDFLLVQTTRGTVELAFDNIRITGAAAPTVTTGTATNISATSASISNNTLTSDGGATLSEYGVVYVAGTGTPTTSNTKVQAGTTPPSFPALFSVNLPGLSPGTTYTARAYATNSVGTSYGSSVTFTTQTTVTSIVRANANPTNAATVQYTVTFATSVTGLVSANFATAPGAGISGSSVSSVSSVSGSSNTYTVTVNTGSGSGSLGLNMVNSIGVTPSVANLPSTGELYTVDKDRPSVVVSSSVGASGSTTSNTPIPFRVTFSENVSGFVAGDVSVTNGSITGGTVSGASPGTTYDFTVAPLTPGTATTVNVVANVAQDAAGNTNTAAPAAVSITYNQPTTTVTSVTRLSPTPTATATVSYQVVFANSVTGVTASNFTVTGPSGAAVATNGVSGSGTTYTVLVNTGTGNGTLTLNVNNSTGISPTVTNVPYSSGEQYSIIKNFTPAPMLRIQAAGSASGNGDVTTFVDVVQVLNASNGSAFANGLQNGSFEANNVPTNFKKTSDGVTADFWSFSGLSGISRNGGDFSSTAADGTSVALIQSAGDNNASISQALAVPTGSYQISFQAIQRNYTSKDQRLNVFLVQNGNTVFMGNIQPNSAAPPTYDTFTSATFNVTAPALTATVSTTSGSPTSTAPIPFSVSFSRSVGPTFTASDITVTGGTVTSGSLANSSGNTYTFTVTPSGSGNVSVSLSAGVVNDENNTQNTASNTVSVQFNQLVTATPVLTRPVNTSFVRTNRPEYRGTAVAGSAINIFRATGNGSFVLTDTTFANGIGNFHKESNAALADGTYRVYVTATDVNAVKATSANSNTNTFTVDTTVPTVTSLTSTTVTNGGTTSTSPVLFTATFSEPVTGLTIPGIQVSNGTVTSGPTAGSGNTSSFQVTPSGAGSVSVQVRANAVQDQANNFNTGSSAYSFTYNLPTTTVTSVTRLSPTPTAMPTVSYQVVFANSVTGVTASNFTVTGPSGAAVATNGVSGSGTTYTVLVNTGTGNGTLTLNVNNSTGISPTVTNVPYSSGEQYSIIKNFAAAPLLTLRGAGTASNLADVTAFVDVVQVVQNGTSTVVANGLQNGSFEINNVPAGSFLYPGSNPAVVASPWAFGSQTGVSRNGTSGFSSTAADGTAVALLQNGGTNSSIAQNLAVPTGSYQVKFLTVQRGNNGVSDQVVRVFLKSGADDVFIGTIQPNSYTTYNTFTSAAFSVTAPALTATITSSAGPSGSSTSTSPIPFSVSFTNGSTGSAQSVGTSFTASDITVAGGTLDASSFAGSGAGPYTFTVTPSSNNTTVSVGLAANVAQDANNTGNTATATYSLIYPAPLVATAQNVTLSLNANGSATLNASSVNNGSSGGAGTLTYTIQKIVYGYVDENETLALTTPNGSNFTQIRFASYGTPTNDANGNYTLGACNSSTSFAAAQNAYVNRSTGSLVASNNGSVGPDPCSGTPKHLAVQAGYSANAASLTYDCSESGKTQYVLLTATDAAGNTSTSVAQVTVTPPPTATLTNATPNPAAAGATVTVTGTNLSGATSLTVNGAAATISNLTSTGFTFVVPNGASANGNIVVTLPCAQTLTRAFTAIPPATYTSSTADQPNTGRVAAGSTNQEILRVAVVIGGGATNPLSAQSFSFTTNGSTNPADIAAARVYYTGTSGTLATTSQFGSAVTSPNGSFTIAGSQQLSTGTNYFFLVYDVAANASGGNVLDATVPSLTISGTAYTPSVTNPAGNRRIVNTSRVAGTALRFTGNATPGYVDFSADVTNPAPSLSGQYSQAVWIKPAIGQGSTRYYVLGNGTGNSAAPFIYVTGNGRLGAGFGTGSALVSNETGPQAVPANEWSQVVTTYNGSTLTVYLNGASAFTVSSAGPVAATRVNYVGNVGPSGSTFFPGDIDEVSQWNRALSQTEVRLLRHLTLRGTENGLVSYLQFNDSGTTTTDLLSGSVGTLTGTSRVTSTAPVSFGVSDLKPVTATGNYVFTGTNAAINFSSTSGTYDVVVSRLDGQPLGTQPSATGLQKTYTPAYWIVNRYSTTTFAATVTYTLSPVDISTADAASPSATLRLFKRDSNSDGAYETPIAATAANAAAGTVTFPVTSFSQTVIGTLGSSPLPVTLLSFTAERTGDDALLRWTTAQEKNNAYFEVQSSLDGREFRTLERVTGHGNSTSRHDYQAKDAQLLRYGASTVYYRLRQVDFDGTAQVSDVVALAVAGKAEVTVDVFPNPAADQLTVRLLGADAAQARAQLFDAQGRLVQQFSPDQRLGADLRTSVQQLPNGVYTLRVQLPGRVLHRPVVISH